MNNPKALDMRFAVVLCHLKCDELVYQRLSVSLIVLPFLLQPETQIAPRKPKKVALRSGASS